MYQNSKYDLLIKNVLVVRPGSLEPFQGDIAVKNGIFLEVAPDIDEQNALSVIDGNGLWAFPGVIDAYTDLSRTIQSAAPGITTLLGDIPAQQATSEQVAFTDTSFDYSFHLTAVPSSSASPQITSWTLSAENKLMPSPLSMCHELLRELKSTSGNNAELMNEMSVNVDLQNGPFAYLPHSTVAEDVFTIHLAARLAFENGIQKLNLVGISNQDAYQASVVVTTVWPELDVLRSIRVSDLLPTQAPPENTNFLWSVIANGQIDMINDFESVSSTGISPAKALPMLLQEARRRGVKLGTIARLTSQAAAQRYGLWRKGDIKAGLDADFVLIDARNKFVTAADLEAEREKFAGTSINVAQVFLRGTKTFDTTSEDVRFLAGKLLNRPQSQIPKFSGNICNVLEKESGHSRLA